MWPLCTDSDSFLLDNNYSSSGRGKGLTTVHSHRSPGKYPHDNRKQRHFKNKSSFNQVNDENYSESEEVNVIKNYTSD
jgi:hypothetical protein